MGLGEFLLYLSKYVKPTSHVKQIVVLQVFLSLNIQLQTCRQNDPQSKLSVWELVTTFKKG